MLTLQTVSGFVAADHVKIADAHAHFWISPGVPGAPVLQAEDLARAELEDFAAQGGSLVVDCQPGACGRDGHVLSRLGRSTNVAIVTATGFHLERYYTPGSGPWALSEEAAATLFMRELCDGLDEAPDVRAGVIKSAWSGNNSQEIGLMRAALETARRVDSGIVIHIEVDARIEELVHLIEQSRVAPGRVQFSHIDKQPDPGLHRDLARAGYILGYDTFLRSKYSPERYVWPLLLYMINENLGTHITLGLDLVDVAQWHAAGGPGLRTIPTVVLPRLRQCGVDEELLQALGGGNITRLLASQREKGLPL